MSNSKRKRKKRTAFPAGAEPSPPPARKPPASGNRLPGQEKRPPRWGLILLFLTVTIGGTYLAIRLRPQNRPDHFRVEVLKKYPHDASWFTQGLVLDQGYWWESTGRYGESSLRKTHVKTNKTETVVLDDQYFGEGLTILNDKIYQLTWKSHQGFVYDRTMKRIGEFTYEGEGWGLTTDGRDLIMSNGTTVLRFFDPETFQTTRTMRVRHKNGYPVGELNELEYVDGFIYANCFQSEKIYQIDAQTGEITAVIELTGVWPRAQRPRDAVLNGIAFDPESQKLLVTGKLCPYIFEVKTYPKDKNRR